MVRWIEEGQMLWSISGLPKHQCRTEWIGDRVDGLDQDSQAGTVLWDETCRLCVGDGTVDRSTLSRVIDRCFSHPSDSLLRNVLVGIAPHLFDGHASSSEDHASLAVAQQERERLRALLETQLMIARLALAVADDSHPREVLPRVHKAVECLLRSRGSNQVISLEEATITTSANAESAFYESISYFASLHRDSRDILEALLQVYLGFRFLTGHCDKSRVKSLIVPFVREADQREGALAVLEIQQVEAALVTQYTRSPLVVSDLNGQALMRFDDTWHQSIRLSAEWAARTAGGQSENSPRVFTYRLRFAFAGLNGKSNRATDSMQRPDLVRDQSAGLAAAILMRAHLENRSVLGTWCVTGALHASATGHEMSPIGGCLPKLEAFQESVKRVLRSGRIVIGKTAADEASIVSTLQFLQHVTSIERSESLQQAYDLVTGLPEAIAWYEQSERNRLRSSLSVFCPAWLETTLNDEVRPDHSNVIWESLDSLTIKQNGTRPKLQAPSIGNDTESFRSAAREERSSDALESRPLDEIVQEFLQNSAASRCLKVIGGPGMGKTWVGIRWHFRLLARFQEAIKGQPTPENCLAMLPIWVTAWELGNSLSFPQTMESALIEITSRRMIASGISESAIASFKLALRDYVNERRVILIVDAWDERDHRHDDSLRSSLHAWTQNHPLILTSRDVGESARGGDPLRFISSAAELWTITSSPNAESFPSYFRKWFRNNARLYAGVAERPQKDQRFEGFLKTPQLAAITCWLLESGQPDAHVPKRPSQLLLDAICEVLEKYRRAPRNAESEHTFNSAIENGRVLELLQLLAFRTFDGTRWLFRIPELVFELGHASYHDFISATGASRERTARFIIQSGLFVQAGQDRMEIAHQALAEVLVASHLLKLHPTIPKHLLQDRDAAVHFAATRGMLSNRWINVWKCYAELNPNGNSLLQFLIRFSNSGQNQLSSRFRSLDRQLSKLLFQIASECNVQSGNSEIDGYASDLSEQALKLFPSVSMSPYPQKLRDEVGPFINLVRQGYPAGFLDDDQWTKGLAAKLSNHKSKGRRRLRKRIHQTTLCRSLLLYLAGLRSELALWHIDAAKLPEHREHRPWVQYWANKELVRHLKPEIVHAIAQTIDPSDAQTLTRFCDLLIDSKCLGNIATTDLFVHYWDINVVSVTTESENTTLENEQDGESDDGRQNEDWWRVQRAIGQVRDYCQLLLEQSSPRFDRRDLRILQAKVEEFLNWHVKAIPDWEEYSGEKRRVEMLKAIYTSITGCLSREANHDVQTKEPG